ncbi:MAG: type II toxin-antitoxin system VapC family toxin [Candidatus Rokubacteria bacterium]|nr:type II toxin-antitoxin system VapC family toxin [Candidatus Rokubacteria bacterium]
MSYFDSAYIAKFYLDEPESDAVRRLAESLGHVRCALIGQIEVAAVFHRKLREGAFDAGAFREVMAQFADDCARGVWTWLPLTSMLAARTAAAFARLPRPIFLRAADALHLVSAQEHGLREIYTNDRHLATAARHFRLRPVAVTPA